MITQLEQLNPNGYYTYADYILWKFQERVELFKGRIFPMAAPSVAHQRVSGILFFTIQSYLKKKNRNCDVFSAPFDVRLPLPPERATDHKVDTVVQPDLCVVCDENKLDKRGCVGAPDLVVEILSEGNSSREMKAKFELYQNAGVSEYWIIDPEHKLAFIYFLDQNTQKYIPTLALTSDDAIESNVLEGLSVNLNELFYRKSNF